MTTDAATNARHRTIAAAAERRETVVVGGGPAGATVARLLALAGRDVLLLERCALPRAKACGDCLSPEATRVLERIGMRASVEALDHARLAGWRVVAHDGSEMRARFADVAAGDERIATGIAVRRHLLDAALLDAARAAGVEVRTRAQVTDVARARTGHTLQVRTDAGIDTLHTRLVIGADGLRSTIARRLGLIRRAPRLRKLSFSAHVRGLRGVDGFGELHLAAGCCVGIAPVNRAGDVCNLTIVLASNDALQAPVGPHDARFTDVAYRVLARCSRLRGRYDELEVLDEDAAPHAWLTSGPFDVPVRRVVMDGAALAGDAAGYYDPFTGQGIYQALAGAERLARVAATALQRPGPVAARALTPYSAAHTRLTRGPRRVQRLVELVTARPWLATYAIRLLAHNAPLRTTLLGVTGDVLPAGALLEPRRIAHALHAIVRTT
jgi:flavin-dependent dehydrogenase